MGGARPTALTPGQARPTTGPGPGGGTQGGWILQRSGTRPTSPQTKPGDRARSSCGRRAPRVSPGFQAEHSASQSTHTPSGPGGGARLSCRRAARAPVFQRPTEAITSGGFSNRRINRSVLCLFSPPRPGFFPPPVRAFLRRPSAWVFSFQPPRSRAGVFHPTPPPVAEGFAARINPLPLSYEGNGGTNRATPSAEEFRPV